MNPRTTLLGAAAGLLLAAILIAGVSLAGGGGGSLHIDLVKTNGQQVVGLSPQSSQSGGTAIATQTTQAVSGAPSISSLNSLTSHGGSSTGLLLLPIVLGAVLGAFFYGSYTRRVDRE
ncbi:MAG: hypothetical protein OK474_05650 [Thaumarchaeota archaeon]|nr:hypothetical protein [Nitrososphaerota archaeon]